MDHQRTEIKCHSSSKHKEIRECCMCGDLGFQERLLRCLRCHHRFQHIYCSKLYSNHLELNGVYVCDWCLAFQAKEKLQSHKRRIELQEMAIRKAEKVAACNEIVSTSASVKSVEKPRMASLKPRAKLGESKQSQPSSLPKDCKLSTQSCRNLPTTSSTSGERNTTKVGLRRRYKLLSDVQCS